MDLYFDRGDHDSPSGHALLYFKVDTEPDKIYASYIVTLPIKADLTKYVPPFLASHLGALPLNDLSAFAMPPVPEPVDGYEVLERLSQQRGDDLVYGGNMFSFDLPRMMESVSEAVNSYGELYVAAGKSAAPAGEVAALPEDQPSLEEPEELLDASFNVNDVLFSFMSEGDKLSELARLLGQLRFAVEGSDRAAADEAGEEIRALAATYPKSSRCPTCWPWPRTPPSAVPSWPSSTSTAASASPRGDTGQAAELEREIRRLQGSREKCGFGNLYDTAGHTSRRDYHRLCYFGGVRWHHFDAGDLGLSPLILHSGTALRVEGDC